MLALLAEMARNETETLRERINSGLAEARRQGPRSDLTARMVCQGRKIRSMAGRRPLPVK